MAGRSPPAACLGAPRTNGGSPSLISPNSVVIRFQNSRREPCPHLIELCALGGLPFLISRQRILSLQSASPRCLVSAYHAEGGVWRLILVEDDLTLFVNAFH